MTAAFFHRSSSASSRWEARLAMLIGILLLGAACLPAAAEADSCPNAAFRTAAAVHLPDCRAYEMVSPPHKLANMGTGDPMVAWASPDGSRIRFFGKVDGLPNGEPTHLVATRGPDGWTTVPAVPMEDRGEYNYLNGRAGPNSPDLSAFTMAGTPGGALNYRNLPFKVQIVRPGVSVQTLATIPGDLTGWNVPLVVGASDDMSHVLWEQSFHELDPTSVDPPAPEIEEDANLLYEWVNGVRIIVSTNPDGSLISKCGSVAANGRNFSYEGAISADGSRVFFRSPDPVAVNNIPACASEPSRLYIREGTAPPRLISAPVDGISDPNGHQPAFFSGASADGDKAFFVTSEQLTPEDSPGGSELDLDLYLYDASSEELKLLTVEPDGTANSHIYDVQVSSDGSAAYVLLERPMVAGTGDPSRPDLYKYDTDTGERTFVATLSSDDRYPGRMRSYMTTSGRFLLFGSRADLRTGVDTGLVRLYRYDSQNGEISCVSCAPGVESTQDADPTFSGQIPSLVARRSRGISEDGQTVVFDTKDALVPADANQARDVYEWHNGTLNLISTGSGAGHSGVAGMSADGGDIFFSTYDQLLPQDQDSYTDIYDARVGGGFSPGAEGPLCSGDSCSVSAAPPFHIDRPASAEARGPGNGKRGKRSVKVFAPGRAALAQTARTGTLRLKVRSPSAGRLRALAQARIGGKKRIVARAARGLQRAGNVTLPLHLSPGARQLLAEDGVLNLTISVSLAGAHEKTTTVSIRRSR